MAAKIQFRRDTAANWSSANPTLSSGELGLVTDTGQYKIGNGSAAWNSLSFSALTGIFASLPLDAIADPSAPSSGLVAYSKSVSGKNLLKIIGPSGLDTAIQSALWGNGIISVSPGVTTALSYFGQGAFTAVGTVSHPSLNANTLRESTRRAIVTSAATANAASELRYAATQCWRGNGAGLGGFFATFRWGVSTTVANQRQAIGVWASTAATATTQQPSELVNGVWVGNDTADTNLQLMCNDATGTASKIDLGANFPVSNANAIFELVLFAKPNDTAINYRVQRLDSPAVAEGSLTTDIPGQTVFLTPHYYANNGGTAAAVVLNFYRYYCETDY